MPMHKLADGPITFTVADVAQVEGKFGMQYKLTSTDGVDVYVNVASFERQLERLKLDPSELAGETLRMEQVQKNGTTFTNVYKANPADVGVSAPASAGGAAAPRTASSSPAKALTVGEAASLYKEAVMATYGTLAGACEELGVPVTADALQAAAATVFIAANRR